MFAGRRGTQNTDANVGSPVQYVYVNERTCRRCLDALANLLALLLETIHARRMALGRLDVFVGPRISGRIL